MARVLEDEGVAAFAKSFDELIQALLGQGGRVGRGRRAEMTVDSTDYDALLTPPASTPPLVMVIFGASGDLTSRKILPALANLADRGRLNENFTVIGVARSNWSDDEFHEVARRDVPGAGETWHRLVERFRYISGDYEATETFDRLKELLTEADAQYGTAGNRVYYLATMPAMFAQVADALAKEGVNVPGPDGEFARIVIEKPFGRDLTSARELDAALHRAFDEDQIFRIDHYMGKETVQNVLALRFANAIFEPIWNRRYVEQVQITVAESIGVEHRGGFYETAGALRDIVQNHVMQVLALTLMEPATGMDAQHIRDEKVKLLRSVFIPTPDEAVDHSVRGQYAAGVVDGRGRARLPGGGGGGPGQRAPRPTWPCGCGSRTGGGPACPSTSAPASGSRTGSPRWSCSSTSVPFLAFEGELARQLRPNMLVLRIQPNEGISPALRGQGARRGVPGPVGGHGLPLRLGLRGVPGGRRLPPPAARRHGRRRHPVHPQRRGRAGVAHRRALPRGVERARGRPALLPGRDVGPPHRRPAPRAVGRRVAPAEP